MQIRKVDCPQSSTCAKIENTTNFRARFTWRGYAELSIPREIKDLMLHVYCALSV